MGEYQGVSSAETQMSTYGYSVLRVGHSYPVDTIAHIVVLDGKLFLKDGPTPKPLQCGHDFSFDVINEKGVLRAEQTSNSPYELLNIPPQKDGSHDSAIALMQDVIKRDGNKEKQAAAKLMGQFGGITLISSAH